MVYLTRKEHFNAAHRLYNAQWTDEENYKVFGKCANPNFHGHNYDLYVTIKGEADSHTGFVMNVKELSDIVRQYVIARVDHRNLNIDVEFMKNQITTTENLAKAIWKELEPRIKNGELHCIKLQETDTMSVEYYGK